MPGRGAGRNALLLRPSGQPAPPSRSAKSADPVTRAIQGVKDQYAPVSHLAIFNVGAERQGANSSSPAKWTAPRPGSTPSRAVERTGAKVIDHIKVLPDEKLGDQVWGISCLSVACGRELPDHKAEMGTQVLMGNVVRVWKPSTNAVFRWYLTQAADGYLSWMQKGTFVRCTRQQVEAWNRGPLLMVTAFEDLHPGAARGRRPTGLRRCALRPGPQDRRGRRLVQGGAAG